MEKRRAIENASERLMLLFVEPEAQDYWLQPGQTFELQAEVSAGHEDFKIKENERGTTVYPSSGMGYISVLERGQELSCGHQRPCNWP